MAEGGPRVGRNGRLSAHQVLAYVQIEAVNSWNSRRTVLDDLYQ